MMFDLDGSDIQTIREALISRDADLREILNLCKSNGVQCLFPVENSLECVSKVMKKISNRAGGGGRIMTFDLDSIDILYIIEGLMYRKVQLEKMLKFYKSNDIEEFSITEDDIRSICKVMEKIRGTFKDNQQEERP